MKFKSFALLVHEHDDISLQCPKYVCYPRKDLSLMGIFKSFLQGVQSKHVEELIEKLKPTLPKVLCINSGG